MKQCSGMTQNGVSAWYGLKNVKYLNYVCTLYLIMQRKLLWVYRIVNIFKIDDSKL